MSQMEVTGSHNSTASLGLGHFDDNVARLNEAKKYLEESYGD